MSEGNLRQRGPNSWQATIYTGKDPVTGKKGWFRTTIHAPSDRQARKQLRALVVQHDQGKLADTSRKLTVRQFLQEWLAGYAKPQCAPRTYERYAEIISNHLVPGLGRIPVVSLQPRQIQGFYAKLLESGRLDGKGGLSGRSVHHVHRLLFSALRHGVRQGVINHNVAEAVTPPRPAFREMPHVATDTLLDFLDGLKGHQYHLLIVTAVFTGARRSELAALKWSDVDLDLGYLSIVRTLHQLKTGEYVTRAPKSKRGTRTIDLPPTLCVLLRELRADRDTCLLEPMRESPYVFCDHLGRPLRPDTITSAFATLSKKAGLGLTFHGLRHAHAILMLEAGVHLKITSERMGHGSIAITADMYQHATKNLQKAAALLLDALMRRDCQRIVKCPDGD